MARRDPYVLVALHRLMAGWLLFKLAAWALFLLVFPAMCLARGLDGFALLLGLLGLFLDLKAVDLLLGWARGWAPALRRLMLLYHGGIALAGLVLLASPIDQQWTLVAGTEDRGDLTVTWLPDGLVVGSGGGSSLLHHTDAGEIRSLDYRGGPSWILQTAADDTLWVAPPDHPRIYTRDHDTWTELPRPAGYVRALAPGRTHVWLVTNDLHVLDRRTHRWAVPDVGEWSTGVALAPDEREVLVVGRRWFTSPDGQQWTDITPPDIDDLGRFPEAAIGGGGWRYVFTSGLWSSTLHVRGPDDEIFSPRTPPASDLRVIVADPHDGRRVWFGTWGEGVHQSSDGGRTWQDLGLHRIQVRGLAIDFNNSPPRVAAGGSNLMFDRGAFVRPLP